MGRENCVRLVKYFFVIRMPDGGALVLCKICRHFTAGVIDLGIGIRK